MARRPPIPADLEREVLLEAGHRCAIHTCRQTPLQLAHITPWAKCKEHRYENLIALCPTCHSRFDRGEIDRKSMMAYKGRLLTTGGRFTIFEMRLLRKIRDSGDGGAWLLEDLDLLIDGLIRSEILTEDGPGVAHRPEVGPARKHYSLTASGQEFVSQYLA